MGIYSIRSMTATAPRRNAWVRQAWENEENLLKIAGARGRGEEMVKAIFVNVAVTDLKKTVAFFTKLGFTFNPQFTDENSTCMVMGGNIFAMLLVEKFFKSFIPNKEIANAKKQTEALIALSVESRPKVDEMIRKAIAAGGKEYREAQDHGWMYGRAFEDLDGHIWEVFHMNEDQMPKEMKKK